MIRASPIWRCCTRCALRLFYRYGAESCLEVEAKSVMFGAQAPGLADTPLAERVDARHQTWVAQLPEDAGELWDALAGSIPIAGRLCLPIAWR